MLPRLRLLKFSQRRWRVSWPYCSYVKAFNSGAFYLEPEGGDTVADTASAPQFWPAVKGEDDIDMFGYAVLSNVRRALVAMAASQGGGPLDPPPAPR